MATRARTVSVHIEYLDHDHGHWCNTCLHSTGLHSTGLRVWVTITGPQGTHLQQRLYCHDCGSRNITVSPDDARHC